MRILAIAINTYKESLRSKFLTASFFLILMALGISILFGTVSIGSRKEVIIDFGIFTLNFCCSVMSIINAVSLFNKEIKLKTIYNILSKPVYRYQFIIGKFIGLVFTSAVLVILLSVSIFFMIYFLENETFFSIFIACYYAFLEISMLTAIVLFFSSFISTAFITGMLSFFLYLIGHSLDYLKFFFPETTNNVSEKIITIIFWALPDFSLFNHSKQLIYNTPITSIELLHAFNYTFFYSLILIVLTCLLFSRRELV